jgi:hypothetical protein
LSWSKAGLERRGTEEQEVILEGIYTEKVRWYELGLASRKKV